MTVGLEDGARHFWNAASYFRRQHDRDKSVVSRIAKHLLDHAPGPIQIRAFNLLKEIHGTSSEHEPPRAS